eukprot:g7901.t1 g7901   contig26:529143-530086(+)
MTRRLHEEVDDVVGDASTSPSCHTNQRTASLTAQNNSQQAQTDTTLNNNPSSSEAVDVNMESTYDSLASRLVLRYEQQCTSSNRLTNNQLFVCVAGGPGSGKSTLSQAVVNRINTMMASNDNNSDDNTRELPAAVVLPMDGFHYTRSELQIMARRDGKASLPVYSRVKSDPVPNGVQLHSETKIVLLEGNYLLAWNDERWAPLQKERVFDETWYIACTSLDEQRERLVQRHLETWSDEKSRMWGEGELGAGKKADANDMLNLEWIEEMSREHADLIIESL